MPLRMRRQLFSPCGATAASNPEAGFDSADYEYFVLQYTLGFVSALRVT
jgi:hypothetical protein